MEFPPIYIAKEGEGDVTLVCTRHAEPTDEEYELDRYGDQSLIVSSKVLRDYSRELANLIRKEFQDGTNLAKHGNVKINLKDDDAEAMEIICHILHHNDDQDQVPHQVDTEVIGQIAVLCDYYKLHDALKPALTPWIQYFPSNR